MIIDASAIVAIMMLEPEADALMDRLEAESRIETHAISVFEAVRAVARIKGKDISGAEADVAEFLAKTETQVVALGASEASTALAAASRYGKGRGRPARLNMGDCFSYACAKLRGVPLLYKGDDFSQTDLA